MVYSCVMFHNEHRLLNLRLQEEAGGVDETIVVQANRTFSGRPRKIIPIDAGGFNVRPLMATLNSKDPWENQKIQRDWPLGVVRPRDDDVFLVSDVDEIHRQEDLPVILQAVRAHGYVHIRQWMHIYKINLTCLTPGAWWYDWISSFAVTGEYLKKSKLGFHALRRQWRVVRQKEKGAHVRVVRTDGHHFSWLGSVKDIREKLRSIAEQAVNRPRINNPRHIERCISEHRHVFTGRRGGAFAVEAVGPHYPLSIREALEDWADWVVPA